MRVRSQRFGGVMDWREQVDGYCERLDPGFWAEPINALTNGAFVLAALLLWPRVGAGGRMLCAVLAAIGLGSFLFHTFAEVWAGLADVLPIAVFVLLYIWRVNRDVLGLGRGGATLALAALVPFLALMVPVFQRAGLGSSSAYAPVALLIALYAAALWRRRPRFARGLAFGAALLALSITARALDAPLCGALPLGTHWLWHLLNATMLGWMIWVHDRALRVPEVVAGARSGR